MSKEKRGCGLEPIEEPDTPPAAGSDSRAASVGPCLTLTSMAGVRARQSTEVSSTKRGTRGGRCAATVVGRDEWGGRSTRALSLVALPGLVHQAVDRLSDLLQGLSGAIQNAEASERQGGS